MITHNIEQGTPEWKRLRLGKITGTRVKDLMAKDNLKLVDTLIAERVSDEIEEDGFINAAMQRGIDYEPVARKEYEKKTGRKVDQFGFITSSEFEWLGYSPDGLIDGKIGLEIKCPSTAAHVMYIRMNCLPNEYKYQIFTAFLVCPDMIEMDFVSWDSRFTIKPIHIITIKRQDIAEEIASVRVELIKFWAKFEKYYDQVTF